MRSLTRTSLALAGLALATATSAWASPPEVCESCGAQGVTVNAKSMRQYQASKGVIPPPPTMMAEGVEGSVCTACQAGGGAPGIAVVGGAAPGYAVVGGGVPSSEPAPIGVMQAGYQSMNVPTPLGAGAGAAPGMGRPSGMPTGNSSAPMGSSPQRRHHIVSHILGLPTFGRVQAERERRERASHAAISYGPSGGPTTGLPASMVYGR